MRLALFVLVCAGACLAADVLPDSFVGQFKQEKDENFDEYLTAQGSFSPSVIFLRACFRLRLVLSSGHQVRHVPEEVHQGDSCRGSSKDQYCFSQNGDKFDYENLTTKKDVKYTNVEFGKEFDGEGLDGTIHKVSLLVVFFS